VINAKTIANRPGNIVLGVVVLLCLAVVVSQPYLSLFLLRLFGLDTADLVLALITVAALALPLAMADSGMPVSELPSGRIALTRRNLMLC
jgi:hypothetical protein